MTTVEAQKSWARVAGALERVAQDRTDLVSVRVSQALDRVGADHVVLKGPATRSLLPPGQTRVSSDVDLLVRPGHRFRAARALRQLGYRRARVASHATTYIADGQPPVDVHPTLPRAGASPRAVWRALRPHRIRSVVWGGSVPSLDRPAAALHLAIHATQGDGGRPMRELEIVAGRVSVDEWRSAIELATTTRTRASLRCALDASAPGRAVSSLMGLDVGPARPVPPRSISEGGVSAFLRSSVHWRQRVRSLAVQARRTRRHIATIAADHLDLTW